MSNTREHILKTALVLFLQKSFKDVTMNEIVQKTGFSKGAFYHYFNSKESLFREVLFTFISMGTIDYSRFNNTFLHAFYAQYAGQIDNSLQEMSQLVHVDNDREFNFNFFQIVFEAASRFPEFLEMEREIYKNDLAAWKNIISTARESGEIKSESGDEAIANLFLYCTDGVFLRYVNSNHSINYRDFLLNAFETIYQSIKS